MLTRTGILASAVLLLGGTAGAQADTSGRAPRTAATGRPTIVLRADVSAGEVRFAKQPEIRVTLVGGTLDSVRVLERRNLPERVQPGVTYRDVFIAVEVVGKLHADCLARRLSAVASRLSADSAARDCTLIDGAARRTP